MQPIPTGVTENSTGTGKIILTTYAKGRADFGKNYSVFLTYNIFLKKLKYFRVILDVLRRLRGEVLFSGRDTSLLICILVSKIFL